MDYSQNAHPPFYWGVATAAFQVEGDLDELTDYGLMATTPGGLFKEPAGRACDHYKLYKQDIRLMATLGFNAYRFSIEWARVEPQRGVFDAAAIEHYRNVIMTCHQNGVAPVVTLHHFSSPRWLIAQGGWESPDTPTLFGEYVAYVIDHLGANILGGAKAGATKGAVCTLNEVNSGVLNAMAPGPFTYDRDTRWVKHAAGELQIPPNQFVPWNLASSKQAVQVILESHFVAVKKIKERQPELKVGLTVSSQNVHAVSPEDTELVEYAHKYWEAVEGCFLRGLVASNVADDFVGVQSYTRTLIDRLPEGGIGVTKPPNARLTQMGYEFHPESLIAALLHTSSITNKPLMVTECGIGTEYDPERIEYYEQALAIVQDLRVQGLPIVGWFAWSFLDNYEWEYGFEKRFGLVHVDYATQSRTVKPSVLWLGNKLEHLK